MTVDVVTVELPDEVEVVNLGLPLFADAVRAQGRPAAQVDWRIPAEGDPELVGALTRLYGRHAGAVDRANAEVVRRLDSGVPVLVGIDAAGAALPGVGERTIVHCGPAIGWADVCDPLRRSVRAAVVAEGWADTPEGAEALLASGEVSLEPANLHQAVVPMASAIGPSAPVFVVDNPQGGTRAFSSINQGPGEVPWFGRETPAAIERLVFLREVAGPLLAECLAGTGPIDVFGLVAQGLQMGDDMHMRTQATTNLFVRAVLPQLVGLDAPRRVELARFLASDHLFYLNLAMAAAKSLTLWAEQVEGSSLVTTMSRNGTTYGIRLAGSEEWFITGSPPVGQAMYYSGYGPDQAAPDIGDSAVLELIGLGGSAAAASPAVAAFVGGTMADAIATTEEVDRIAVGRSSRFKLPTLDYRGTPMGIDVRRVVELGITPKVNTGILHATDGTGQVGAGVAEAPLTCFREALLALDRRLG
ncbi:MAG TPA: DUF1116 domain-containing protein [Acidimicrobiales bacterium]|nr:DUF1116 domain-containing protein [Acidimicrobiales bacterium]